MVNEKASLKQAVPSLLAALDEILSTPVKLKTLAHLFALENTLHNVP